MTPSTQDGRTRARRARARTATRKEIVSCLERLRDECIIYMSFLESNVMCIQDIIS